MGNHVQTTEDKRKVLKRFLCGACALALAALAAGCGDNSETTNAGNANSNTAVATNANASNVNASGPAVAIRTAPDGSLITTETVNGVTTETRTFNDSQ